MSIKEIQNGSLYTNKENNLVFRVRNKANSNSVFATYEDNGSVVAIPIENLRKASNDEVNYFLA